MPSPPCLAETESASGEEYGTQPELPPEVPAVRRIAVALVAALAVGCGQAAPLQTSSASPSSPTSTIEVGDATLPPSPAASAGGSPSATALPFGCPSDFDGELNAVTALQAVQLHLGTTTTPLYLESYSAKYTQTHDGDQVESFQHWTPDSAAASAALGDRLTLSLSGAATRVDAVVARYFRRSDLPSPLAGSNPTSVATRSGELNSDGTATIGLPSTRTGYVVELTVSFENTCFTAAGVTYVSVDVE
jgi:hypothetical protein